MSTLYGMVSKTQAAPDASHLAAMRAVLPPHNALRDSECHDQSISLGIQHPRRPLLTNESGTITLACIGAIPNYRDLREELLSLGHTFATPYDAETLVHLYEEHGANLLSLIKGPFAFALWDAAAQRLILATDPMAQKPIYYYEDADRLIFSSTILALLAHPSVPRQSALTDSFMLAMELHTGQMPGKQTAFKDIGVLGVGEQLIWEGGTSTRRTYWQMPMFTPAEPEATILDHEDRVREQLAGSVRLHLTPEESVGVFLSGGISSSLIAAMMQQQNRPLHTFTGRFGPRDTPEITRAAEVAKHLGAEHTVIDVSMPDLSQLLPRLVWQTANPFLAPHDLLIGLLSESIQEKIDVVLMGTGGTPLLGNPMPEIKARPRFRRMWQAASTILQRTRAARQREDARAADSLALFSPSEVEALMGVRPDFALPPVSPIGLTLTVIWARLQRHLAPIAQVSAAYGLEAQVPFADAQVMAAAALVPLNLKQRPGQPLYILHELARGLLPSAFLRAPVPQERMPLDRWLREQSVFVRELLLGKRARKRGLVNHQIVETLIEAHMAQHDNSAALLALMSLELWHRLFIDAPYMTPPS